MVKRDPKLSRTHKISIALNDYEVAALDKYCKKYRVKNRTKLVREILFTKIFTDFNSNPPTLFGEDEMARLAQK